MISNENVLTNDLERLIAKARKVMISDEERVEQRRSFAYGNAAFENEKITKEMIREQEQALTSHDDS